MSIKYQRPRCITNTEAYDTYYYSTRTDMCPKLITGSLIGTELNNYRDTTFCTRVYDFPFSSSPDSRRRNLNVSTRNPKTYTAVERSSRRFENVFHFVNFQSNLKLRETKRKKDIKKPFVLPVFSTLTKKTRWERKSSLIGRGKDVNPHSEDITWERSNRKPYTSLLPSSPYAQH